MKALNSNNRIGHYFTTVIGLQVLVFCASCEEFVKIAPPKNQLVRDAVFEDDATANAAIEGVYSYISAPEHYIAGLHTYGVPITTGMSADEYNSISGNQGIEFFENEIGTANTRISNLWKTAYSTNYQLNAIIEGLSKSLSKGVSISVKNQLLGEALFLRAFNYFYLVNLFGDVPLLLTTDYRINALSPRDPVDDVYTQIIIDLKEAQNLLPNDYSFAGGQRVRVNKWVATAMLARVYLYVGDWTKAEAESTSIISNGGTYALVGDLSKVFQKNSNETIWQLVPQSSTRNNAVEAYISSSLRATVTLSNYLINAFEPNDKRRTHWIQTTGSSFSAHKYKAVSTTPAFTEYSIVMRLAEQYLIRAEARIEMNDISGAIADLNVIRNRAGLPNTTASAQESLLTAIYQERRVELFAENGHRWLDLKRRNMADDVLGGIKPHWQAIDKLYPIAESEILRNPNLVQNPGYDSQ